MITVLPFLQEGLKLAFQFRILSMRRPKQTLDGINQHRRRYKVGQTATNIELQDILHVKGIGTRRSESGGKQVRSRPLVTEFATIRQQGGIVLVVHFGTPQNTGTAGKLLQAVPKTLFPWRNTQTLFGGAIANAEPRHVSVGGRSHGQIGRVQVRHFVQGVDSVNLLVPLLARREIQNVLAKVLAHARARQGGAKSQEWCSLTIVAVAFFNFPHGTALSRLDRFPFKRVVVVRVEPGKPQWCF
mmetsp:Transcript_7470/g.15221  ORF Transcript_7470/g.15221 Transcript_7470/m.15221 type:complete len:243 (-) Transcript_7470:222-950(-)